jgi:hypothetical protein
MTIVASCGVSVVAFEQSGMNCRASRRHGRFDLVHDDQIRGCCTALTEPIVEGPALSIWPALCQAE